MRLHDEQETVPPAFALCSALKPAAASPSTTSMFSRFRSNGRWKGGAYLAPPRTISMMPTMLTSETLLQLPES